MLKNLNLKPLYYFIAAPILLLMANGSVHLLSVPNDLAVIGGYALGVLTIMLAYYMLRPALLGIWRLIDRHRGNVAMLSIAALICIATTGCYRIVNPGKVGLLVKQTGSDRGVQDYPIQSGRVFYNPFNEDVLEWPTNVQRVIWSANTGEGHPNNEEIAFQSKEGLHFTADINAAYQMQRDMVPHFYVQFRTEDMEGFTHGFFRDAVRNAFNNSTDYTAEEINGSAQTELINKVQKIVTAKMAPYGVDVIQIGFAAPPRPPEQVKDAIEGKIAAIQSSERIEFEKRSAVAEGAKILALAQAQAQANQVTSSSITPTLIEWKKIDKWDGHNSQVVTGGSGALVNVK